MVRKVAIIFAVAFAIYFVLNDPEGLASIFSGIGSGIASIFESIITFFTELF